MESFNTRGYSSIYEDMLAGYPMVGVRVFSKNSVFETIPVLGLASDFLSTQKGDGSSVCTVVDAARGGCLGYPGVMLVVTLSDAYEGFLEDFAGEPPSPKCILSKDGSKVEAWLFWEKHLGGRYVSFRVMPELIQEMVEKVNDLVGSRRKSIFVKMNPVYVPIVFISGDALAFGGFWYDGFLDEEIRDHQSYAFNHEPAFDSDSSATDVISKDDSAGESAPLQESLDWVAPLPEFLVGVAARSSTKAPTQVAEEDI